MTLITFQDGKPVMRDGKVGTEQGCCCGGGGCPSGCPSLDGCNLVVVLNYPGFPVEVINFSATDYVIDQYINCQLAFNVEDIPIEFGGDITGTVTIGHDGACNAVVSNVDLSRTVDNPDNEQSCDDGITECVEVLVSIDCNPLP